MEWYNILGMVLGNLAIILPIWLWARSENRSDMRRLEDTQALDRRDFIAAIRGIESNIVEIRLENKEFHHRLLEIERNR